MKIAVASSDGTNISPHFGQSSCFLIFDVVEGKIAGKEVRNNTFTAHARGECSGGERHGHGGHDHSTLVEALHDCQAVLCLGMGRRAEEALAGRAIQPLVLAEECSPEEAVAQFLEGTLVSVSSGSCRHHA